MLGLFDELAPGLDPIVVRIAGERKFVATLSQEIGAQTDLVVARFDGSFRRSFGARFLWGRSLAFRGGSFGDARFFLPLRAARFAVGGRRDGAIGRLRFN